MAILALTSVSLLKIKKPPKEAAVYSKCKIIFVTV